MFPFRPVAIPDQMFDINMNAQQPMYGIPQMLSSPPSAYEQPPPISSDPISAFEGQPQITSDPISAFGPPQTTSAPPGVANPQQGMNPDISLFPPQQQHPYQPGQYGGAYQNLAMQMAGFPGPQSSGARTPQYMNPAAFMGGGASSPGELHNVNQGTHPQSPGGDIGSPTNQTINNWLQDQRQQAYQQQVYEQNFQTAVDGGFSSPQPPSGPFTPMPTDGLSEYARNFYNQLDQQNKPPPPSGPQTPQDDSSWLEEMLKKIMEKKKTDDEKKEE